MLRAVAACDCGTVQESFGSASPMAAGAQGESRATFSNLGDRVPCGMIILVNIQRSAMAAASDATYDSVKGPAPRFETTINLRDRFTVVLETADKCDRQKQLFQRRNKNEECSQSFETREEPSVIHELGVSDICLLSPRIPLRRSTPIYS